MCKRELNELYVRTGDSLGGRYGKLQDKSSSRPSSRDAFSNQSLDSVEMKELKVSTTKKAVKWATEQNRTEEEAVVGVGETAKDRQERLERYLAKASKNVQKLLTEIQLAREELMSLQQHVS